MFLLTAAASGMYANTGPITAVHLSLIAVLIVLVLIAVLWGTRQKRARNAADAQEAETAETMAAHPITTAPVSPAPPPLGDSGMTAITQAAAADAPVADEPAPATASTSQPSNEPTPASDNYRLVNVKGLGPKAVPLLDAQGVSDLAGLAALTPERAAQIDASLGTLAGRMARDRWVEQAKLLAAGDVAGFEATYGKL